MSIQNCGNDFQVSNLSSYGVATKPWARDQGKRVSRARAKKSVRMKTHSQVSSPFGSWSPSGLPNLHRAIVDVKTPHIEEFFISLESY
jgi:hypothetical protein